jgi:hypothetical protein
MISATSLQVEPHTFPHAAAHFLVPHPRNLNFSILGAKKTELTQFSVPPLLPRVLFDLSLSRSSHGTGHYQVEKGLDSIQGQEADRTWPEEGCSHHCTKEGCASEECENDKGITGSQIRCYSLADFT